MLILSVFCLVSLVQANSIFFDDIKTLTFYGDKMTTRLRTPPTPQLQCVGETAKCLFQPQIVRCSNNGRGATINWKCESMVDSSHRFSWVGVVCEGYEKQYDEYVRVGSCGLEYTIEDGGKLLELQTEKYFLIVFTCLLAIYLCIRAHRLQYFEGNDVTVACLDGNMTVIIHGCAARHEIPSGMFPMQTRL